MGRWLVAVVLVAWLGAHTPAARAELGDTAWPKFHGDLLNSGQSAFSGPTAARVKWIYSNPARWACRWTCPKLMSSPTLGADGTIYLGVGFEPLCAIDPATGTELWCTPGGGDANMSSPAVSSDGTVYMGARDNKLWAVNPDGSVRWTFKVNTDGDILGSPAIGGDGTVYMACNMGAYLHALRPDGTLRWRFKIGGASKNL